MGTRYFPYLPIAEYSVIRKSRQKKCDEEVFNNKKSYFKVTQRLELTNDTVKTIYFSNFW